MEETKLQHALNDMENRKTIEVNRRILQLVKLAEEQLAKRKDKESNNVSNNKSFFEYLEEVKAELKK